MPQKANKCGHFICARFLAQTLQFSCIGPNKPAPLSPSEICNKEELKMWLLPVTNYTTTLTYNVQSVFLRILRVGSYMSRYLSSFSGYTRSKQRCMQHFLIQRIDRCPQVRHCILFQLLVYQRGCLVQAFSELHPTFRSGVAPDPWTYVNKVLSRFL